MLKRIETDDKNVLYALLFISFIVLSLISYSRFIKQETFTDEQTYCYLTSSNKISINSFSFDNFGDAYFFELLLKAFNHNFVLWALPILLGVFTIFLFFLLLDKFGFLALEKNLSIIILILSPAYLKVFTSLTPFAILLPMVLGFILFFLHKHYFLTALFFLLISLIYYPASIILGIFMLVIFTFSKEKNLITYSLIGTLVFLVVIGYFFVYPSLNFSFNVSLDLFVTEFGLIYSISTFTFILFIIGIFSRTIQLKTKETVLLYIILFMLGSLFFANLVLLTSLGVCILASFGIIIIYNHKWRISTLKNLTMMLIIYGLLFSALSSANSLIYSSTQKDVKNALTLFNATNPAKGSVLSEANNACIIEYSTGLNPLLSNHESFKGTDHAVIADGESLFYSRNLGQTKELLQKREITYFVITPEMKQGGVFMKADEGLLFLLNNANDFKKIINYDGVEIWRYG